MRRLTAWLASVTGSSKWETQHATAHFTYQIHSETGQRRAQPKNRRGRVHPDTEWLLSGSCMKGCVSRGTWYGPMPIVRDRVSVVANGSQELTAGD